MGSSRSCIGSIKVFATNFGITSNDEAELRAMIVVLRLCQQIGITQVDIECDSKIVVDWISRGSCRVWYLWDFWEELLNLLQLFEMQISHVFREGNQVADFLAKLGATGLSQYFYSSTDLPRLARGLVCLDQLGVVYLHK